MDKEEKMQEIMELIENNDGLFLDVLDFLFGDSLMDRISEELEELDEEDIENLLVYLSREKGGVKMEHRIDRIKGTPSQVWPHPSGIAVHFYKIPEVIWGQDGELFVARINGRLYVGDLPREEETEAKVSLLPLASLFDIRGWRSKEAWAKYHCRHIDKAYKKRR